MNLNEAISCPDPCQSPASDVLEATLAQRLAAGQLVSVFPVEPVEVIDSRGRSVTAPGSSDQIGLIAGCVVGGAC